MFIFLSTEALSESQNAVVLSIEAKAFSMHRGFSEKFFACLDLMDQKDRTINVEAVETWMDGFCENPWSRRWLDAGKEPVRVALERLMDYMACYLGEEGEIWVNKPDVEYAIMENLHGRHAMQVPWRKTQQRCLRTLRGIINQMNIEVPVDARMDDAGDTDWYASFIAAALSQLRRGAGTRVRPIWMD